MSLLSLLALAILKFKSDIYLKGTFSGWQCVGGQSITLLLPGNEITGLVTLSFTVCDITLVSSKCFNVRSVTHAAPD